MLSGWQNIDGQRRGPRLNRKNYLVEYTNYQPPRHKDQTTSRSRSTKTSTTRHYRRPPHSDHLTEGGHLRTLIVWMQALSWIRFLLFLHRETKTEQLTLPPCEYCHRCHKKREHGAQTVCRAHTTACQTKKNNKYLTNLWYNCHNQSFVHVFSQRTFLYALQFRSFHLKYVFYIFRFFCRSPVLLKSFPVEAELYRDVCAVLRAVCIVWLIGVPILKIFCDQHLSGRAV